MDKALKGPGGAIGLSMPPQNALDVKAKEPQGIPFRRFLPRPQSLDDFSTSPPSFDDSYFSIKYKSDDEVFTGAGATKALIQKASQSSEKPLRRGHSVDELSAAFSQLYHVADVNKVPSLPSTPFSTPSSSPMVARKVAVDHSNEINKKPYFHNLKKNISFGGILDAVNEVHPTENQEEEIEPLVTTAPSGEILQRLRSAPLGNYYKDNEGTQIQEWGNHSVTRHSSAPSKYFYVGMSLPNDAGNDVQQEKPSNKTTHEQVFSEAPEMSKGLLAPPKKPKRIIKQKQSPLREMNMFAPSGF